MQRIEVDCSTGLTQVIDLSPEEEAAHLAQQETALQAAADQRSAVDETAQKRADALDTVLNAPEIAGNPDLRAALAHLLGAE